MPSAARFDEDFLVNGCKKVVDNYKLYEAWEEEYPYPTYDQVQIVGSKFTDLKQMAYIRTKKKYGIQQCLLEQTCHPET